MSKTLFRLTVCITGLVLTTISLAADINNQADVRTLLESVSTMESTDAVDFSGSVSADGSSLIYTDWSTGDLALLNFSTGVSQNLTNKGTFYESNEFAVLPAFSPDGMLVAYYWWRSDYGYELRVSSLDFTEPRVLYRFAQSGALPTLLAWSPNGRYLAAALPQITGGREITLITLADESRRVLKELGPGSPGKMAFSPDGRYLAFDVLAQEGAPERDIVVISSDDSQETLIVQNSAEDFVLGWYGEHLVFASDRSGTLDAWAILVADGLAQGSPELILSDLGPQVVPIGFLTDGSLYYSVIDQRDDLYVAAIDPLTGMISTPNTLVEGVYRRTVPDWSPDGQQLIYVSQRGRNPEASFSAALVARSFGTELERKFPALKLSLNTAGTANNQPQWSPDGRSLLVLGWADQGGGLFRVDVQTGDLTTLTIEPSGVVSWLGGWSSDGHAIFHMRQDQRESAIGRHSVLRRNLETGTESELFLYPVTAHPSQALSVSPDGQTLAFIGGVEEGLGFSLSVAPASGGEPRELLRTTDALWGLDWMPDGRHLVFGRADRSIEGFGLWRVAVQGGEPEYIGLNMAGMTLRGLSVHPNGGNIAFTAGSQQHSSVRVVENLLTQLSTQQ